MFCNVGKSVNCSQCSPQPHRRWPMWHPFLPHAPDHQFVNKLCARRCQCIAALPPQKHAHGKESNGGRFGRRLPVVPLVNCARRRPEQNPLLDCFLRWVEASRRCLSGGFIFFDPVVTQLDDPRRFFWNGVSPLGPKAGSTSGTLSQLSPVA